MKIAGLNQDIIWKDKAANFNLIEKSFEETVADLFLVPEMFPTGFCMEPAEIADKNEESLTWMRQFAKNKNAAICGSASVLDNGRYYNRMYFVKPDGQTTHYDKRHLFSYSGEDEVYTAGRDRVTVEYMGIRILLQVCYDLRFPVFARNRDDYDLAIYVANWPEKRVEAWVHLLKARAIENLACVFGLNRIGHDGNDLHYPESSHCFFADGSKISEKSGNIITANIDLAEIEEFRENFGFLNDRDEFKLQ